MTLRIGSLCSGYEGLGMAVQAVLGGDLAWVADPDPGATKILQHHYPDVPNLGDITTTDWEEILALGLAVEILLAGFPCQDISYAGRGAGIKEGTRSGIFYAVVEAVRVLRPRLVLLENVAGITSRRPGLDVVLAELARIGFDAEWVCVHASDVGAPHPRKRWFLAAWPAAEDPYQPVGGERRLAAPGQAESGRARADAGGRGGAPAADTDGVEPQRRGVAGLVGGTPAAELGEGDQRERAGDAVGDRGAAAAHSGYGVVAERARAAGRASGQRPAVGGEPGRGRHLDWGPYAGAIERWEAVSGHAAPVPTEPGRTGQPRLSPAFVEWLMGLPVGHVTDPAIGLTRTQQLHALGNGVVPQQGAHALRLLLERACAVEAA